MPKKNISLVWKTLFIVLTLLSQLACHTIMGGTPQPTPAIDLPPPADTAVPTGMATSQPQLTEQADQPGQSEKPSLPQPEVSDAPGMACLGTFGTGVTCVDDSTWATYSRDLGTLDSNLVQDVAACPDGQVAVVHSSGIGVYDGGTWREYEPGWGLGGAEAIACDKDGGLWIAHFEGASYFDGSRWRTYPAQEYLSTGIDASDLVRDVLIAPSGAVWVVTASSLARFRDGEWVVYQEGAGFDDRYFFERIATGSDGRIWAVAGDALFAFDGEIWEPYPADQLISPTALAVDVRGRVWVGTHSHGLYVLEDQAWRHYTFNNSALASDSVRDIVVDGQGRVWLGTEWGLNVVRAEDWATYRMDNAGMGDHDIYALGVVDGGPALPPVQEKSPGSLRGQFVDERGKPLARATVEVCVEKIYSQLYEETPCTGQPYSRSVQTNNEGEFYVEALPPGYYVVAIQYNEAWAMVNNRFGLASERFLVTENEETYIGEIDIQPEE